MSMKDEIADGVKDRLRKVVDSFAGVLSFEVHPGLSEAENVHRIISQTALVCAVVGCVTKVPLSDIVILTPIHVKMTLHIAKVKGFEISKERALDILRELLSTIGLSLVGLSLASFLKMIPVVDVLVYVPIIYGTTYGIGRVVEVYFHGLKTGKIPTADELRDLFKSELSIGKVAGASLSKQRLDQAYAELKKKVDEREAKKESGERTPLGIRVKEKPVRRPKAPEEPAPARVEKTIGEGDGPLLKTDKPELVESKKTIGPATPAAGVEVKAVEKSLFGAPSEKPAEKAEEKPKLVDELERLAKLKELGALTADEFETAKKKLLG